MRASRDQAVLLDYAAKRPIVLPRWIPALAAVAAGLSSAWAAYQSAQIVESWAGLTLAWTICGNWIFDLQNEARGLGMFVAICLASSALSWGRRTMFLLSVVSTVVASASVLFAIWFTRF